MTFEATDATPGKLHADAANRAVRTALLGLLMTIGVAVTDAVLKSMQGQPDVLAGDTWKTIGTSALTAAIIAAGSYVMRRWGDPSPAIPTPLPPSDDTIGDEGAQPRPTGAPGRHRA